MTRSVCGDGLAGCLLPRCGGDIDVPRSNELSQPSYGIHAIEQSAIDEIYLHAKHIVPQLKPDGTWELHSVEFKKAVVTLASGSAKIDRRQCIA